MEEILELVEENIRTKEFKNIKCNYTHTMGKLCMSGGSTGGHTRHVTENKGMC